MAVMSSRNLVMPQGISCILPVQVETEDEEVQTVGERWASIKQKPDTIQKLYQSLKEGELAFAFPRSVLFQKRKQLARNISWGTLTERDGITGQQNIYNALKLDVDNTSTKIEEKKIRKLNNPMENLVYFQKIKNMDNELCFFSLYGSNAVSASLTVYLTELKDMLPEGLLNLLISTCIDLASAFVYVKRKDYVFACLNCEQVIVEKNGVKTTAKVADLSTVKAMKANLTSDELSELRRKYWRWLSPDVLSYQTLAPNSDVWPLGIIIWSIFSFGMNPYQGQELEEVEHEIKRGTALLERPFDAPDKICNIIKQCMIVHSQSRPKLDKIKDNLELCLIPG